MTTLLVVPLFFSKVNADTMSKKEFAYFYPFHWVSQGNSVQCIRVHDSFFLDPLVPLHFTGTP